jgi:hypothetical protein
MKNKKYNFKQINVKADKELKKFEEFCDKLGIKKAAAIKMLIAEFNKNPMQFLKIN